MSAPAFEAAPPPTRTPDVAAEVRSFLTRSRTSTLPSLEADTPLLENQILDSIGVLDLVQWIERRFSIQIDEGDLTPANFNSLAGIVRLIERCQPPAVAPEHTRRGP